MIVEFGNFATWPFTSSDGRQIKLENPSDSPVDLRINPFAAKTFSECKKWPPLEAILLRLNKGKICTRRCISPSWDKAIDDSCCRKCTIALTIDSATMDDLWRLADNIRQKMSLFNTNHIDYQFKLVFSAFKAEVAMPMFSIRIGQLVHHSTNFELVENEYLRMWNSLIDIIENETTYDGLTTTKPT